MLLRWPWPDNKLNEVTLWRWLERSVEQNLILKDAGSRRNEPFRYWLAGRQAVSHFEGVKRVISAMVLRRAGSSKSSSR